MQKHTIYLIITFILSLVYPFQVNAQTTELNRIWAIDDTEKIKKTDSGANVKKDENGTPLYASPLNEVWNNTNKTISVFGARNEFVGFQIILEANNNPVNNVQVELVSLQHQGSNFQIKNSTDGQGPYEFVGKRIEIFKEEYLNLTRRSIPEQLPNPNPYYIGWIPEILVPHESNTSQSPLFSIPANQNQALWIDLYIPPEAPAGEYTGNVKINRSGQTIETLPLKLRVYNFTLSDELHTNNFFIFFVEQLAKRYPFRFGSAELNQIEKNYFFTAKRNRIDLSPRVNLTEIQARYKNFINGDAYTRNNGYEGPGKESRNTMYAIGAHDLCKVPENPQDLTEATCPRNGERSEFTPMTRNGWWNAANRYISYFKNPANKLQDIIIFRMLIDEPRHPSEWRQWQYDRVIKYADWLHSNPGVGKQLKTFVPAGLDEPALYGSVDFWGLGRGEQYQQQIVNQLRQQYGNKFGLKNANRPYSGSGIKSIDSSLTEARAIPWVMRRYQLDHLMFWSATNNYGDTDMNMFVDPHYTVAVGTGRIFYPGTDQLFPSHSKNLNGPLINLRAKGWREGIQDLEYIHVANQMGLHTQTQAIIHQTIPRAMDEITDEDLPSYSEYGYAFEKTKKQLAELIERNTVTPTATPTPPTRPNWRILLSGWFTSSSDQNLDNTYNIIDWLTQSLLP